jgi:hypothetical protein
MSIPFGPRLIGETEKTLNALLPRTPPRRSSLKRRTTSSGC